MDFDENSVFARLIRSLGPFGFIAVDPERVNLDDLIAEPREGMIVRVVGNPDDCIKVFAPGEVQTLGCVAGWISDGD